MYKKLCSIVFCSVFLASVFTAISDNNFASAQNGTKIIIVPSSIEIIRGQESTVYINVTNVEDLYAWEFQLTYNPLILDLTSCAIVPNGLNEPTQTFYSLTDEVNGLLWWAVSTTHPTREGISYESHAIFEIRFKAVNAGTSPLTLRGTILSNSQAQPIEHTTYSGVIYVKTLDLVVTSIKILNKHANEIWMHSIYANDTWADGAAYYYPVNVTIKNTGTLVAANFKVKLEVYYGTSLKASAEKEVITLEGGASKELTFHNLFHPTKTGDLGAYILKATVDSENTVIEDDETNNQLLKMDFMVTIMGDINRDRKVNILDGVILALAWTGKPGDPQWNTAADLNHDDEINILDGTRMGLNWGKSW
ncbi:MAG: cohesin domain-containing protein [Candidatus Bathyarchaeota archaeon]|nr:cohesin domain-containing protein [Candidatus Bathyarchaeota archaeon]MDW8022592.1 CARDB domain-containing protein [Nitrososphaerota archaeon]